MTPLFADSMLQAVLWVNRQQDCGRGGSADGHVMPELPQCGDG
jgi:hypothetical protein